MPELTIELNIECATCGVRLNDYSSVDNRFHVNDIKVEVCYSCMHRRNEDVNELTEENERLREKLQESEATIKGHETLKMDLKMKLE